MNQQMRRSRQELDKEACEAMLAEASYGVLALCGENGVPYAVPLNFVYCDGSIFFHCAPEGLKLAVIRENPRVSFCAVCQSDVMPEKLATRYRSVIAFGEARVVQDDQRRRYALLALGAKLSPEYMKEIEEEIEKLGSRTTVVEISVDCLTGKQSRDLVKSS